MTKIGVWAIIEYWLQGGYKITMSDLEILQLYLGRLFISVHYYREKKKGAGGRHLISRVIGKGKSGGVEIMKSCGMNFSLMLNWHLCEELLDVHSKLEALTLFWFMLLY